MSTYTAQNIVILSTEDVFARWFWAKAAALAWPCAAAFFGTSAPPQRDFARPGAGG